MKCGHDSANWFMYWNIAGNKVLHNGKVGAFALEWQWLLWQLEWDLKIC